MNPISHLKNTLGVKMPMSEITLHLGQGNFTIQLRKAAVIDI